MSQLLDQLPADAIGLKLYKIIGERLIACEPVYFEKGRAGVEIVLRRASISGRVEVEGAFASTKQDEFFADVLIDQDGTWNATVLLDRNSYRSLKNHWMRCKVQA